MRRSSTIVIAALAVALGQIGFLAWMIQGRASILRDGRDVLLQITPVDPRDLLRGDYVILSYDISQLPIAIFERPPEGEGEERPYTVFVRLAPGEGGLHRAVAARFGAPPSAPLAEDEVDIRGLAWTPWRPVEPTVGVTYGLERFYLPEGEGLAIETDMRERPFRVRAAVGPDGAAIIRQFLDGDTPVYEEPWY
jgi:uncharacterized membrane-anchored protein